MTINNIGHFSRNMRIARKYYNKRPLFMTVILPQKPMLCRIENAWQLLYNDIDNY